MNRSLRAHEPQMQGVSRQRHHVVGALKASTAKEKEEDLALFLEMRRRDKERNNLLLEDSRELEQQTAETETAGSPLFKAPPVRRPSADDFLNSDSDKNDYDWLLTPPGTPLFPSLETESNRVTTTPKSRLPASKSRLASTTARPRQGGPGVPLTGQRPGTPTRTAPAKPARSATPSSRPGVPLTKPASSTPRSSTPVTRPAVRSSTPVTRSTARSSTPTGRPSIPQPRVASRAATPTPRPSTPSSLSSLSSSLSSSSSHLKLPASAVPPRGTSPPVKSRPWKPSEMPGFSLDAPPNLRTSLPDRPVSASRGRAGAPSTMGDRSNPRPRRQSCSPARTRPSGGPPVHTSGGSIPAVKRTPSKPVNNSVSPVAMGAKMVERVISMRKLVPPKQEDKHALHLNNGRSPDPSIGFGRTLSKKSLDMAIRHMDIRRSIPSNLRPLMTNIPASSIYSVRSGSMKGRSTSSPLATSSNASSELSVSNNVIGIELEDWD